DERLEQARGNPADRAEQHGALEQVLDRTRQVAVARAAREGAEQDEVRLLADARDARLVEGRERVRLRARDQPLRVARHAALVAALARHAAEQLPGVRLLAALARGDRLGEARLVGERSLRAAGREQGRGGAVDV